MDSNKKEAPEVEAQEQPKYSTKDLETMALKIVGTFYYKKLSLIDAKKILEVCNELIDLNSRIVLINDEVKVGFLSRLSE